MKAIAIKGNGKRGKTSTIRSVYDRLLERYPGAEIVEGRPKRKEVSAILAIKKTKIGIRSVGDPSTDLGERLEDFRDKGCGIIICACRSKGETVDAVKRLAEEGYEISWYHHDDLERDSEREARNEETARQILGEVAAIVG